MYRNFEHCVGTLLPSDLPRFVQKKKAETEVGTGVSEKAGESSVFLNDAGDQVRHYPQQTSLLAC